MGRNYLRSREEGIHQLLVDYMRLKHPDLLFRTDLGGVRLPMGLAIKVKKLQAGRAWPDFFVAEPVGGYHGLYLELKKDGTVIYKKDGSIRASDNNRFEEQAEMLKLLRSKGYAADFAIGLTEAIDKVEAYLTGKLKPLV